MSKTLQFVITMPEIPDTDQYSEEYVKSLLMNDIRHPYDAAYDADITVELLPKAGDATHPPRAAAPDPGNPSVPDAREGNGCMIYGTAACES